MVAMFETSAKLQFPTQETDTCDTACLIGQPIHHINIDVVYSTEKCPRKHMGAIGNARLSFDLSSKLTS